MSQYDFGTIDPVTKSGTALATDLNNWRDAVHSTHKGSSRPSYAPAGMVWADDSASPVSLKYYDGTDDIVIGTIDESANTFSVTLANNAVTSAKINDLAVTSAKINDDAVTLAKMAAGTDGSIFTYDTSGNPTTVAPGTTGQVLTTQGAGAVPIWSDVLSAASTAQIRAGAASVAMTPATLESALEAVALSESGGNVALDWSSGFTFTLTMTGDWTLSNPTNEEPGTWRQMIVTQGSTGSHVLSFGTDYKFAGGFAPVLSTPVSSVDVLFFWNIDGTTTYVFSALDFS